MEISDNGSGGFQIVFQSPFRFGDQVWFESLHNGKGTGTILDIILQEDGQVYYAVQLDGGEIQSGIYPNDIKFFQRT